MSGIKLSPGKFAFEPVYDKTNKMTCAQQRLRSAWESAQSDQSLSCPHEEALAPQLPLECTAKTLIRLGKRSGWSESLLGAQVILLVLDHASAHFEVNHFRCPFRATDI